MKDIEVTYTLPGQPPVTQCFWNREAAARKFIDEIEETFPNAVIEIHTS